MLSICDRALDSRDKNEKSCPQENRSRMKPSEIDKPFRPSPVQGKGLHHHVEVACRWCTIIVGSMVKWLKRRALDQHGLGSKPTRAILLCPWERHFTAHSPAWWSWQAVLNYSHISIKLQADSNILASPEAGRVNCLPYVLALPSFSCDSGR